MSRILESSFNIAPAVIAITLHWYDIIMTDWRSQVVDVEMVINLQGMTLLRVDGDSQGSDQWYQDL